MKSTRTRILFPLFLTAFALTSLHSPSQAVVDEKAEQKKAAEERKLGPQPKGENIKLIGSQINPTLQIPEGMTLGIFAGKKEIQNPTAITIDEKGRVFAVETHRFRTGIQDNRDNRWWITDDVASETTGDRLAMYKKWDAKRSFSVYSQASELIRVFEDTDKDGKADKIKVYADQFDDPLDGTAAGIIASEGNIYFACLPRIWKLGDRDGNLESDERVVLQDGLGVRVSFSGHDLNGFAWGPDGKLYFTIGDRGFNFTTKEGRTYKYPDQGGTFRMNPDGSDIELIYTGQRNPKEVAFDAYGNLFTVDNNADMGDKARLVYVIEGGDSGWRMGHQIMFSHSEDIGLKKRPPNRWMAENMWKTRETAGKIQPAFLLPPIAHITSGPSGLAYYPGTGLPGRYANHFFVCDYRGTPGMSGVHSFEVAESGAGFELKAFHRFFWRVAVTDVEFGYNGRLYISDYIGGWSMTDQGHIYTITNDETRATPEVAETEKLFAEGFKQRPSAELSKLLSHPDMRVRLRAQFALVEGEDAAGVFTKAAQAGDNLFRRLHGVWGLGQLARYNPEAADALIRLLGDENHHVRAQSAKCLGDATIDRASAPLISVLSDQNAKVQSLAGIALGKLEEKSAVPALIGMIQANKDRDVFVRHGGVMGLSKLLNADELAGYATHDSKSVRLAALIGLVRTQGPQVELFLEDADPLIVEEAMRAINDNWITPAVPALAKMIHAYDSLNPTVTEPGPRLSEMQFRRILNANFRLGKTDNASALVRFAINEKLPEAVRLEALRLIAKWTDPHPIDQTVGIYRPLEKRDPEETAAAILPSLKVLLVSARGQVKASAIRLAGQYNIPVDAGSTMADATNQSLDSSVRLAALESMVRNKAPGLPETLVKLIAEKGDAISIQALHYLAESSPRTAVPIARKTIASGSLVRRQGAWDALAKSDAPEAAELVAEALGRLTAGSFDPSSELELLEAAAARKEESVVQALKAYRDSIATSHALMPFHALLEGGNPETGRKVIWEKAAAQCTKCHALGEAGNAQAGPDLAGVGSRGDRAYLLESLVNPSAKIAAGFGSTTVTTKTGTTHFGLITSEKEGLISLLTGEPGREKTLEIKISDVQARSNPVSGMFPMVGILSNREIRDVVSFLASLKDGKNEGNTIATAAAIEAADGKSIASNPPDNSTKKDTTTVSDEKTTTAAAAPLPDGKTAYAICAACHGADGVPLEALKTINPPLKGSEWINADPKLLAEMQLRGLQGPIEVSGTKYGIAPMPANGAGMDDATVAAVINYVRTNWADEWAMEQYGPATAEMVAQVRTESTGKGPINAATELPPLPKPSAAQAATSTAVPEPLLIKQPDATPSWVFALGIIWVGICILPMLFKGRE